MHVLYAVFICGLILSPHFVPPVQGEDCCPCEEDQAGSWLGRVATGAVTMFAAPYFARLAGFEEKGVRKHSVASNFMSMSKKRDLGQKTVSDLQSAGAKGKMDPHRAWDLGSAVYDTYSAVRNANRCCRCT